MARAKPSKMTATPKSSKSTMKTLASEISKGNYLENISYE
jgi:hypothetical protein